MQTGYAGIYTDVTLEAEAVIGAARTEVRFQDIIHSPSDWVWETDVDLNLTYVSSRISETLEVPPGSLIGRNIFALGVFLRIRAMGCAANPTWLKHGQLSAGVSS